MVRDELGGSTWSGRCRLVFHVQSCGGNGKHCVDGSERLLSWVGVSVCVSGPMRRSVSN